MGNLIEEKARRARFVMLGVAIAIAAGISGWLALQHHRRHAAVDDVIATWSAFSRCFVGEPQPGEPLDARVNLIELGNVPPEPTNPWPGRCKPLLEAFRSAIRAACDTGVDRFDAVAKDLAAQYDVGPASSSDHYWRERLLSLFTNVASLQLPTIASTGPLPPTPAQPLVGLWSFGRDLLDLARGDRATIADAGSACTIPIATGDPTCAAFGDVSGVERAFIKPFDPGPPQFAFAGTEARHGIYRLADAKQIWIGHGNQGVSRGGVFAALGVAPDVLVRWRDDKLAVSKLPANDGASIVGDLLTWIAKGHLFVQHVLDDGSAIDAGAATGELADLLCSAGDTTVYASKHELWFVHGDRWQSVAREPVHSETATCSTEAVAFASADVTVSTMLCKPSGCAAPIESPRLHERKVYGESAAVLGDKILVLGQTEISDYESIGLWMTLAPIGQLDKAHRTFLTHDASSVAKIIVQGNTALTILNGSNLDAIRIDATGHTSVVARAP